jgi:hypothetical protein
VEHADHVGAVVHRDRGVLVANGVDVRVVGLVALALDRVHLDVVAVDEGGRDVILRRQRVGGAERDLGATGSEGADQVGGLRRDVKAKPELDAVERPLA